MTTAELTTLAEAYELVIKDLATQRKELVAKAQAYRDAGNEDWVKITIEEITRMNTAITEVVLAKPE